MLKHIFLFELKQGIRSPSFLLISTFFFICALYSSSTDIIMFGGVQGGMLYNAPIVTIQILANFCSIALLLNVVFLSTAANRDYDNRTIELVFSKPVTKFSYFWGRFSAGFFTSLLILFIAATGFYIGTLMPWVPPERLAPFSITPYIWSFVVLIIPSLLISSASVFFLATITRSILITYTAIIFFIIIHGIAIDLSNKTELENYTALLDPFGIEAISQTIRYWSIAEKNTLIPELNSVTITNRLIWIGISFILLVIAYHHMRLDANSAFNSRKINLKKEAPEDTPNLPSLALPRAKSQSGFITKFKQVIHHAIFNSRAVIKSTAFIVMLLLGGFSLINSAFIERDHLGGRVYATSAWMAELMKENLGIPLFFIIAFFSAELVFRNQNTRISNLTDAYPNGNWAPHIANLLTLIIIIIIFQTLGGIISVAYQIYSGNTAIDFNQYLYISIPNTITFAAYALFMLSAHMLSNNKFVGFLIISIFLFIRIALPLLGVEDHTINPLSLPQVSYSEMNKYNGIVESWLWHMTYWLSLSAVVFMASAFFWVRGNRFTWKERFSNARQRLTKVPAIALSLLATTFLCSTVFIIYNTHYLNDYRTPNNELSRFAEYEKRYAQYKNLPLPRITRISTEVDIYPEKLSTEIKGTYRLTNPHDTVINEVHITSSAFLARLAKHFEVDGVESILRDESHGYFIFKLAEPLPPHGDIDFNFKLTLAQEGFASGAPQNYILENGTFFNSRILPIFGFDNNYVLTNPQDRKKFDLPDLAPVPTREDESARNHHLLRKDADLVTFETTLSTSLDQIAIAPGYLQREWEQNGRRYFYYTVDIPIRPFVAWLSARWDVKRSAWENMPIEVYYHSSHHWNVDHMILAAQRSLDYYSANFSPYQYEQLRIVEFPGYRRFAQSFPNTIPYSEKSGFTTDVRDTSDIDLIFYVTAHEVAHQWWPYQVISSNTEGAGMLTESLSQYSALMVMEKQFGPSTVRKILKRELSLYLNGRAKESGTEQPLARATKSYLIQNKGALVFYALRDYIGEETLNSVLREYLLQYGDSTSPYPTTREFLSILRNKTDLNHHRLIDDLFEKIILWDNRLISATAVKRSDGRFDVSLTLQSIKLESQGLGETTPIPLNDEIEIGIFAQNRGNTADQEKVLYLAKHYLTDENSTIELIVDELPYEVGIDPYNKLIDRFPDDNRKRVSLDAAPK